jgi:phospholipid/cholesterol/gamma-HCH transport system substrate-binding protein
MKRKGIEQNIKLGIFVLVGIVLFLVIVVFIGSQNNLFDRTFTAYAVFKNVEGLKDGDNVWLSGVKIGTVRQVRIASEGRVIVTLSLRDKQNQFIKKNATAFIGSDGLVGNKIVVIRPGDATETIQHADTIMASSPADTQQLINIARDVGENTRSLTTDLKMLLDKVNAGHGVVGDLLTDGALSQDIRKAIADIKGTTTQTAQASQQLNAMLQKLNHGDGLLNTLITDTAMTYVFHETLNNVREVSRNSAEVSRGLEELMAKINDSNNALGVLLADTAFANTLRETLGNAESASAKLEENMDALRSNFLLRGYFRRQERRQREAAEN